MHAHAVLVALALIFAPLGARAADLVVWWEEGFYPQEDEAVRETVAAFEQGSGKKVELVFYEQDELPKRLGAALEAGRPPDFAFGVLLQDYIGPWAVDDRLVDLSDTVGHFSDLFDADALAWVTWRNVKTKQGALYGLPVGREINHAHVWKNLLKEAGFTVADIPREWQAFWSFWCDQVQPAVRKARGREDIWGVALPMSVAGDTGLQFFQFVAANQADYVTKDGRFVIDDPEIRPKLVKVIDSYTALYRKGCTPPDSVTWNDYGNNKAFLAQTVVMTTNNSLSSTRLSASVRRTTTRTPPRSNGRSACTTSPFQSWALLFPL
jgi:multiple sugar transport system substrate-binding protein